jgi:hypothetical protein
MAAKAEEIGLIVRQPRLGVKPSRAMSQVEKDRLVEGRCGAGTQNPTDLIAISEPIQNRILTAPTRFSTIRWQALR